MRLGGFIVKRRSRMSVKTAFVGLLVAPTAMAQQMPQDPSLAQTPPAAPPAENNPAEPSTAPATMAPVTVTGTRPSEDFQAPVTSINRLGGDVRDIPQSVTVINKALMQSQGATSFQSAVRNVPGLTIGAAEGGSIGNAINLNGFSARTDLYLDGMRDRAQYYRDTFALEQVEVLMGPSSMLFGRGSTGGVINQVMKKPTTKDATELSASVTSNGLTRGTADVNHVIDPETAARVNMMFQRGKTSTRDHSDVLDFGIAPSVKLGIGTPTEITLSALLQHNHDQTDYGIGSYNGYPLSVPRNTAYNFTDDYTDSDQVMLNAVVDHTFNKDVKLHNQTQFVWVRTVVRETSANAIGTVGPGGFTATPFGSTPLSQLYVRHQSRDRTINDYTVTNQTELTTKFDTGPIGHTLLTGIELGYDAYQNQATFRNGTCNGVALQAATATTGYVDCAPASGSTGTPAPNVASRYGNFANGEAWSIAPYINDTIQLIPEVKLVAGVRFDSYYAQVGNSQNTTNGATAIASSSQTVTFPSWRAGVIYQPTNAQSYYASWSTSFNPSLEQLVGTTGANAPLLPENNQAFEVGGKWDVFRNNLSLSAAAFQITKSNARALNTDGTYSSTGTIRVQGFRAGATGRITDEWQVFSGYTFLAAQIIDGVGVGTTGMVPLNTPRDSATLWTTYTINKTYEIGGGATYMGLRYANNTDTVIVPAYVRFDATAAYKQEKYDIRLNLYNLTDTYYYEQAIPSDGGRAVPGSGFTAMLSYVHRL